MGMRSGSLKA